MSAEGRVQKFAADFKKVPGMLSLTATHVSWVPNEAGKTDRQSQSMARVISKWTFTTSVWVPEI